MRGLNPTALMLGFFSINMMVNIELVLRHIRVTVSGSSYQLLLNKSTTANQIYNDAAIASSTFANVSITTGDYIEISEAQLEINKVATPFEHRSYGEELALCQRYYQRKVGRFASGYASNSNTTANVRPDFNPNMRAVPTMSAVSFGNILRENVNWYAITAASISEATTQNCNIALTIGGTHTMSEGHATVIGNGAIYDFDAEL